MKVYIAFIALVVFSLALLFTDITGPVCGISGLRVQDGTVFREDDGGVYLIEDGAPRFFYQKAVKSLNGGYPRAHYFHPVYDLDGGIITEDFPEDHPHHRGVFWAWPQLYRGEARAGNGWLCENFVWDIREVKTSVKDGMAVMTSFVVWMDRSGVEYAAETMEMTYRRLNEDAYEMSFNIYIQALSDDIFIGGSEDDKGYGGFSVRINMPEQVHFEGGEGVIIPAENTVKAGGRVSIYGKFNPRTEPYYITITADTDENPFYKGWILRERGSMQNIAFPGPVPEKLPHEEPLILRNKIIVHRKKDFADSL